MPLATLAVALLAEHPESYASAFAVAPGPLVTQHLAPSPEGRPLVIMVGEEDQPSARAVAGIERAWESAHEPIWIVRYPGDHRLPGDWRARLDDALTWIVVKSS